MPQPIRMESERAESASALLEPETGIDCSMVARALANSLAPGEAECQTPEWLRPDQGRTVRRVIHTLALFRGCLLADPVGTGKTYIALAVAALVNGPRDTCCIVPPSLVTQWSAVARRLGVRIQAWSHARLSRGRPPPTMSGLVVIDESHHFRNPGTVRYRTLAPWITGKPTLMLSATPVVNRADDLMHQLRLAVRGDALRACGVGSLQEAIRQDGPHAALGNLIIVGPISGDHSRPGVRESTWRWPAGGADDLEPVMEAIRRLELSDDDSLAQLLRGVFWRAQASSPEALRAVAKRYQSLLQHARDAAADGKTLSRAALRDFTADAPEQLVMWSLLAAGESRSQLSSADLPKVAELLRLTGEQRGPPDLKVQGLHAILEDGKRSLVFVNFTSTVDYLRRTLRDVSLAWCTGSASGVGNSRVAREDVLAFFRPQERTLAWVEPHAPRVLITTDVAAEGLDLHTAERVVHYDLPWHEVRVEQRNGRAVRAGSVHRHVAIVRFEPPASLDRELQVLDALDRKARIAKRLGLTTTGRERWRWRARMVEELGGRPQRRGMALAPLGPSGFLAGLAIRGSYRTFPGLRDGARGSDVAKWFPGTPTWFSILVWMSDNGWTEDPGVVAERLTMAHSCSVMLHPSRVEQDDATRAVRRVVREVRERLRRGRWAATQPTYGLRPLIYRLRHEAVRAARDRDGPTLRRLDDALLFLAGGHTAGEEALIARLSRSESGMIATADFPLADLPVHQTGISLTGLIIFRPE